MRPAWLTPAAVSVLALMASPAGAGQTVGIHEAVWIAKSDDLAGHVEIVFEAAFGTASAVKAAEDPAKYKLIDLYAGPGRTLKPAELPVRAAAVPALNDVPRESLNTVQVFPVADLPALEEDRYVLVISGLALGPKTVPVSPSPTRVTMTSVSAQATAPVWSKAKDKDAADLYFSGAVSRSKDTDFYGSADIKVRLPLYEGGTSRLHSVAASYDLTTSANPEADPDSQRIGAVWQFFPIPKGYGLSRWENAIEQEASRDFDYRTVVWRSEWLYLPPPVHLGDEGLFWINPLAGVAAGGITAVPDGVGDEGSLFRLLGGASATLEVPIFFGKTLSFNGTWQVRHQYQEEIVDKVTLGRGTHRWVSLKAEVLFNDYVSFGAVYQDGEEPPTYKDVKRSLTFDLTFKAARKNKPQ